MGAVAELSNTYESQNSRNLMGHWFWGGGKHDSELDRWNAISRKMLSLNKCRINEGVGRSQIHKELQDCIRMSVGGQEKSEWVRNQQSRCIESEGFCTRKFNAILASCRVSRTAQSFFKSVPEDTDLSWSVLDAWALEEPEVDCGKSLAMCNKRGRVCHQDGAIAPGELAFHFS